jgi:amino acid transporter
VSDDEQLARDAEALSRLGYAQQLLRDMGGFGNFALSFSTISILTGAVTLYGTGLSWGGPLEESAGWILVSLMTLAVAASLAELASAFPTAGALYHWSSICGDRTWGWFTAWLNTIGQFATTAGVDYGLALFVAGALGLPTDRLHVLPIYAALLASHALLNHVGVRVVSVLNWLSAWYHLAAVAVLVAALSLFAPLRPIDFLFTRSTISTHGYLHGFLLGLLQAQWTFTGYDASAHVGEETVDPSRRAPWGIVLSVAVSGLVGLVLLATVTRAIGDLPAALKAPNPFLAVLHGALPARLASALAWLVIGAMWFCGLASITSNSRMVFAFARDGGLPASPLLARVSPRFRTPHVAVWCSAAAALAVALWARAYDAMVALSTIALYASYAAPIGAGLVARLTGRWRQRGPWSLGRFSTAANVVALVWVAVVMVLFVLPPFDLAGWTFALCVLGLILYWYIFMERRFRGPRILWETPARRAGSEGGIS